MNAYSHGFHLSKFFLLSVGFLYSFTCIWIPFSTGILALNPSIVSALEVSASVLET